MLSIAFQKEINFIFVQPIEFYDCIFYKACWCHTKIGQSDTIEVFQTYFELMDSVNWSNRKIGRNDIKTALNAKDIPKARWRISSAINDKTIDTIKTADCLKHVVDQLLAWLRISSQIGWPIIDSFDSCRRINGRRATAVGIKKVTWTRDRG